MKNNRVVRKLSSLIPLLSLLILLGACSSITKGTSQEIFVETQDVKEAKCTLKNSKGQWVVESTPGRAEVKRGGGALNVHCEKVNYEPTTQLISQGFEAMTLGNVLIGGIIGIAVDAASGAAFNYPDTISILMRPIDPSIKDKNTLEGEKIAKIPEESEPKENQTALQTSVVAKPKDSSAKPVDEIDPAKKTNPVAEKLAGNWAGFAATGCADLNGFPAITQIGAQVKGGDFRLFLHRETDFSWISRLYLGRQHIPVTQSIIFPTPHPEMNKLIVNFDGNRDAIFIRFSPACEIRLKRTHKNTIPDEYAAIPVHLSVEG
ncbi:MAG: hypothetical protein JKX94_04035 [Sneathiella sp.]|nr:hypothetical protein [Sneathiella sp.]